MSDGKWRYPDQFSPRAEWKPQRSKRYLVKRLEDMKVPSEATQQKLEQELDNANNKCQELPVLAEVGRAIRTRLYEYRKRQEFQNQDIL